ncbi:endonuclease MutS2, partial [bacterium]|nr:endonuclease MutS2 [candidate division CSSED10-310 bacterium]
MNDHALHVLEYADLLEYLSRYTESEVARSIILNAEPETDYRSIKYQLDLLTEFRKLRWSGHPIPTIRGPENDWSDNIRSSKLENWILTADCIAGIGRIIDMTTTISDGMKKLETIPLLKQTVDRLVKLPELSRSISRTVSDKGGILDSASPQLALFRRNIRKQQERIRTRLEEMAVSLYEKGAVQEPIVTIRNGRYVLPVRSGSVRDVPGMVHDRSASGATFFIEPKGSMSDHNALTKLEADVLQEETRILRELTSHIGKQADLILRNIEIIVELDVLQAKARFCDEVKAEPIEPERTPVAHIIGGRNPLLVLHRLFSHDPEERVRPVVPLDVTVDDSHRVLIITGPNTGGKTVALRTIGLLVLMVQTGLHPTCAESSRIGLFHNIFADIGDEQSVQQSLSTFSSHVKQIIKILELADHRSLVLLDELGAGTDPAEGSALGIAILVELLQRGVWVIANTHHNTIKAFAFTTEGISNAAMEFNIDTLEPTYRIVMGRIGQSNALAIAARLGFPDRLVHRARDHMEGKILDLQTMLDEVDRSRLQAEEQIARANNERS